MASNPLELFRKFFGAWLVRYFGFGVLFWLLNLVHCGKCRRYFAKKICGHSPWKSRRGGFQGGFSATVGELGSLCEEICYCKGIRTRNWCFACYCDVGSELGSTNQLLQEPPFRKPPIRFSRIDPGNWRTKICEIFRQNFAAFFANLLKKIARSASSKHTQICTAPFE